MNNTNRMIGFLVQIGEITDQESEPRQKRLHPSRICGII